MASLLTSGKHLKSDHLLVLNCCKRSEAIGILPTASREASINLILIQKIDSNNQKVYKTASLINLDVKALHRLLENWIQHNMQEFTHSKQYCFSPETHWAKNCSI